MVIDTDPGIDDLVALALAVTSPHLEIVAITTTYGNATLESTTRNTRELLRLADRGDVPLYRGCDRPLVRDLVTAPETHGITGVGYATVPAPAPTDGLPNHRALLQVLAQCREPIVLVTLGPLTNLAWALRQDSDLVRLRIARHIGMFGSLAERGSIHRWADFNTWCDPEAADLVLRAGINTVMVGLDVTRRMVMRPDEVQSIASSRDPVVRWLGEALQYYVESHARRGRLDGCALNDVVAVGELVSPGLLQVADRRLCIDLDDGEHQGHTRQHSAGRKTCVAVDVDVEHMRFLLAHVFGDDWRAQQTAGGIE
ncbi:MAG: nucleoside hydrolase [Gemmatimonadota bacterium]|nr:MAG: nucleoside hydrolase [Gemmatimonadota bacterium]